MNFEIDFDKANFYKADFCTVAFYAATKAYLSRLRNASTNSHTNSSANSPTNNSVTSFWENLFGKNQCQTP